MMPSKLQQGFKQLSVHDAAPAAPGSGAQQPRARKRRGAAQSGDRAAVRRSSSGACCATCTKVPRRALGLAWGCRASRRAAPSSCADSTRTCWPARRCVDADIRRVRVERP